MPHFTWLSVYPPESGAPCPGFLPDNELALLILEFTSGEDVSSYGTHFQKVCSSQRRILYTNDRSRLHSSCIPNYSRQMGEYLRRAQRALDGVKDSVVGTSPLETGRTMNTIASHVRELECRWYSLTRRTLTTLRLYSESGRASMMVMQES